MAPAGVPLGNHGGGVGVSGSGGDDGRAVPQKTSRDVDIAELRVLGVVQRRHEQREHEEKHGNDNLYEDAPRVAAPVEVPLSRAV